MDTEVVDEETHRKYDLSKFSYDRLLWNSFPMRLLYNDLLVEVSVAEKYMEAGRK